MQIRLDQPIAASADEAQAAFIDPAFYRDLGQLDGISAPELRSFSASAGHVRAVLGYRFSGQLNGVARQILDPAKLTWAQVTEVDLATRRSEVHMVPDNYAGLLSFEGWYELRSTADAKCCQHFEADLRVHLPLLGPVAERAIAGSIRENVAATARLLERHIAAQRSPNGDVD